MVSFEGRVRSPNKFPDSFGGLGDVALKACKRPKLLSIPKPQRISLEACYTPSSKVHATLLNSSVSQMLARPLCNNFPAYQHYRTPLIRPFQPCFKALIPHPNPGARWRLEGHQRRVFGGQGSFSPSQGLGGVEGLSGIGFEGFS